jgi:tripartite-type tricarboxylate transporter receptor subunit TctC
VLRSVAALAAVGWARAARSEPWPRKPVRIVVPFAAGGNSDIVTRIVAQQLGEALGHQFVVENRPGASGALAAEAVVRAPADGYTLFMATLPQIAIVPVITRTSYDPVKDFAPISNIGTNPFVLVVHPSMKVDTVRELVDYARRQPNELSYVASGVGSLPHLSMVLFLKRAGLGMIPVMYKGGAAPLTDVIAGHVKIYFANLSVVVPHATSGVLRLLAVSSEKRAPQIPDVPTFIESGFPDFKILTWNGLMAPAGTPKDVIDRIASEVARAVEDPYVAERLISNGFDPLGNSPEEFAAMIAADIPLWAEAVKMAGLQGNTSLPAMQ